MSRSARYGYFEPHPSCECGASSDGRVKGSRGANLGYFCKSCAAAAISAEKGRLNNITADYLRQRLSYDRDTGIFTWKPIDGSRAAKSWNSKHAGKIAGGVTQFGYHRVYIDRVAYQSHCLAWLYVHGDWPSGDIDHRDRDRTNNRICNLRLATRTQNNANSSVRRSNQSGAKGVSWDGEKGKWQARIAVHGRRRHIGYFGTKEEASDAYTVAAREAFGSFANAGGPHG